MPVAALRAMLGAILAVASLGVSTEAGADIPAAAIVGGPTAIGVLASSLHRRRDGTATAPAEA